MFSARLKNLVTLMNDNNIDIAAITDEDNIADSTGQCNFTHGMMREAAMPKCFSPSKVKEHECEPITASLRVSVTKFMR